MTESKVAIPIKLWKQWVAIMCPVSIFVLSILQYHKPWQYCDIRYRCCQSVHAFSSTCDSISLGRTVFYTEGIFTWDIITFVRFMHCYRPRIIDSHTVTHAEVDRKIHQSVHFLSLTMQLTLNFCKKYSKSIILIQHLW